MVKDSYQKYLDKEKIGLEQSIKGLTESLKAFDEAFINSVEKLHKLCQRLKDVEREISNDEIY